MRELTKRSRPRVEAGSGKPGRKRPDNAPEIGRRLRGFILRRFKKISEVSQATGIAEKTARRWMLLKDPTLPDTSTLITLSKWTEMSLNWLLLGDGPELKGASGLPAEFADQLRATVVAEVASGERVSRAQVEAVLPAAPMLMREFILRQRLTLRDLRRREAEFRRSVFRKARERVMASLPARRASLQAIPLLDHDPARGVAARENQSRLAQLERLVADS